MKWKVKLAGAIVCLVILTIVGVTSAFYSNQGGSLENVMSTKSSGVYAQELFVPEDYWLPGESKQKEIKFGNHGKRDQVIRFRIETQWFDSNGDEWTAITENPPEIKWTEAFAKEWTSFADDDDWYYYKKVLPAGGETATVMAAVKFSGKLSNDSQIEDFTHATYRITIYMEALDVDAGITTAKWQKTFTQNGGLHWRD